MIFRIALAACLFWISSASASADPAAFSYSNPLEFKYDQGQTAPRREVRDPCIIREGDTYYLDFTMWPFSNREERHMAEPNQGGSPGLALYSSKDLKNWAFENWLVKSTELPDDCPYKNRFWAPEIHKIGGKFYIVFTADNWIDGKYNKPGKWGTAGYSFIGVADKVTGPYQHITYVEGGTCDMTLFADADGKTYAIKPKGDVFLQQIDLTQLDKGEARFIGPEKRVVTASNDDIGLKTSPAYLEGPWLERIGSRYCLFYAALYKDKSAPDLVGDRTGVAYADSMAGPWHKDPRGAVFFGGHLAVFDGPDGGKWFSYRNEKDDRNRGLLCIDPIRLDAEGRAQAHETLGPAGTSAGWHPAAGPLMTRWAANVVPEIVLSVWNPSDSAWQLRGKQSLHPAGCNYTTCSGVWQTVWAEPVPTAQVSELKMVTDIDPGILRLTISGYLPIRPYTVTVSAYEGQLKVAEATSPAGPPLEAEIEKQLVDFYHSKSRQFTQSIDLPVPNARLWSPDAPFLYDLKVELKDENGNVVDSVTSYFGMRKVAMGRDKDGYATLEINGKRTLLAGALDQGYWPDGVYTAATDDALRYDFEAAKQLGINCLRKHVKVEPQRWYYWADKLGMMVLQDMPTGNEGDAYTDKPRGPEAAAQCESEMRALIRQRWSHPSVIGWVMFNEGWGQHGTLATAEWAKQLDPTRLIDEASGFPWHGGGDIRDHHGGAPGRYKAQIGIVSENGGWGLGSPGHDWSAKSWTYNTCDPATGKDTTGFLDKRNGEPIPAVNAATRAWFTSHMVAFYKDLWDARDHGGGTGNFFCQLIDVEDECDGLLSYDRAVFKVDAEQVRRAARGELSGAK